MRVLAAFLALFFLIAPAAAAPTFPTLTGRVVDGANILSPATEGQLTQKLAALEARTSRQLVVVTLPSLQGYEISDYGYQLGRHWGIGQKKLNNGVLFIIAPKERATRIEVAGLEGILTDALSSVIIQTQVLPHFRKNDYDGGIAAGTDALIQQLSLERSEAEARAAAAAQQDGSDDGIPDWLPMVLMLCIFAYMFYHSWAHPGRRGGGGGPYYGGGGWSGGGGRSGGGGFSGGGGGGFNGGGASGRW